METDGNGSPQVITSYPRIPYGEMSFRRIRVNGWLYVDKTRYLRLLEDERHVFFIRPPALRQVLPAVVVRRGPPGA